MSGAVGHGCWPLYLWNWETIPKIWEKQKQIKRETGLGLALSCTRSVFILLLFYYLFIFLSIYFFFSHSPFMNSGLGSEGNHIVTIKPPPESSRSTSRGSWRVRGKLKIITNVWIFLDILWHGRIHLYIPLCIRGLVGSSKNGRICFWNEILHWIMLKNNDNKINVILFNYL